MALTFYYGSGSPFSWKVWLALEHKQLPYELKVMSIQSGELKTLAYLSNINPRGKVPVLIEDSMAIWESTAIVEYLEERFPDHPILPLHPIERATARRITAETNNYLYPVLRRLLDQTLFRSDGNADLAQIATTLTALQHELAYFEGALQGNYFAGSLSVADFALYPMLALVKRLHAKQPQHGVDAFIGPGLNNFMQCIEQLSYFSKTTPPHWKG